MARAGRRLAVPAALLVAGLLLGCRQSPIEIESRRVLGSRVQRVSVGTQPGADPALVVTVRLVSGTMPESAACAIMRVAAAEISRTETVTVGYVGLRTDGGADLVDYSWSPATGVLIRCEGTAGNPDAKGVRTLYAEAFATGVSPSELQRIAEGSSKPNWQPWPKPASAEPRE